MKNAVYDWSRCWVPRDGQFAFDSQGFLLPPGSGGDWLESRKSDVVGSEILLAFPCLVLLGEPGIGKTFALAQAEAETRKARVPAGARILSRNLNSYSSDALLVEDVFGSGEFRDWQERGGELHVFLDSFDECLYRIDSLANLLASLLGRLSSIEGLFLRVASRTAEWRTSLEDALCQTWGKEKVGVYELAPLTRPQVLTAAAAHFEEPERFVEDIVAGEVVPFAIKPLTLELLMRVWEQGGRTLPTTQREIYERGCLALCREPDDRQTPRFPRDLSPEQRLAVASHVAAATLFCNRAAIWTGSDPEVKPQSDISLAELAQGSVTHGGQRIAVTDSALRASLATGLFNSRGRDRLGWSHQTYAEFLAARYLMQEGLTHPQILDLLTHPHDPDRKLIPQLEETAAWVATPASELFVHIARGQPDVLLRSDVAGADAQSKSALLDALVAAFADERIRTGWWAMHKRFRKLRHRGLACQLLGHLQNHSLESEVRARLIWIADACGLSELLQEFVRLALDVQESYRVREVAAAVVARSQDQGARRQLRPLALGMAGSDPEDELRGCGLTACWPEHLEATEMFAALIPPQGQTHGVYEQFLSDQLLAGLQDRDLPQALAWAESQPGRDVRSNRTFGELPLRILETAARHLGDSKVVVPFTKTLLVRLRLHDLWGSSRSSALVDLLESRTAVRRRVLEAMVPVMGDPEKDTLLVTRSSLRLATSQDLPWLLDRLGTAKSPEAHRCWALLISWVFTPDQREWIDCIIEASEQYPALVEAMPRLLKPVVLDSAEAIKARARHAQELEFRRESVPQQVPTPSSIPPVEQVQLLLGDFEAGDVDAWWRLSWWLGVEEDGSWSELPWRVDIRGLPGWKLATDAVRSRMVSAAEAYLHARGAEPAEWFSKRNWVYYPAEAGLRALFLLASEAACSFEALAANVWDAWMPAVLRPHHFGELDAHRLLVARGFQMAAEAARGWTLRVLDEEHEEGDEPWVLQKLPERTEGPLGAALLAYVQRPGLKPGFFEKVLAFVLERGIPGALEFARSKVAGMSPSDAEGRRSAICATRLLMAHGERGDWACIWQAVQKEASFGRELMEGLANEFDRRGTRTVRTLNEVDMGALWEWMLTQYPPAQDPNRGRGGEVTTRWAIADFRDRLLTHLADVGSLAACAELRRLLEAYPQYPWLRQVLLSGLEQMRRLTWQPVSPHALFELAAGRHGRLVESGDQLLAAVLDSLTVLQEQLRGETPTADFLWDGTIPKREEAISDWIKLHLEADLKKRGVVVGREVQIHRGERTDVHVWAVVPGATKDSFGDVRLIIEVKGCWHPELRTAMQTQLVGRYLKDSQCQHGLYLVGWFAPEEWSADDYRKQAVPFPRRSDLEAFLAEQARALRTASRTIVGRVLDFSRPAASRAKPDAGSNGGRSRRPPGQWRGQ